jgi:ectoine hydroxylase-related dioxygenase (phytanoyl-CoA dioxygenase family)
MLTHEEIEAYRERGYMAVENVLTTEEVEELRRVTDEFVEKSRLATQHTDVFDLEPGHTATHPRLRRIKDPINHHEAYARAIRHTGILGIVGQLIGPGIRTNGNKLNMKSAGFGSPVEWHQDWAFYPHTNDDLLAVGVCIDEMTLENGALLVIPGSHRGPVYDHHQHGRFCGAVTDPAFKPEGAVPVEVPAGGISIHHVRTLHGSAPNLSDQPRRLLLFQYCAVDAWPLTGIGDWDAFNRSILVGEPTNVPRMVSAPVRMPYPPAERQGSIYENQSVLEKPVFRRKAG